MTEERIEFTRLIRQGVSGSEACRRLGIDRKTGHWWKNGGTVTRNGITTFVKPVIDQQPEREESARYLSESERVQIADGAHAGKSARKIAAELGRAVSTVSRELKRNQSADGVYRPHTAQAMMQARRARRPVAWRATASFDASRSATLTSGGAPSKSSTNST